MVFPYPPLFNDAYVQLIPRTPMDPKLARFVPAIKVACGVGGSYSTYLNIFYRLQFPAGIHLISMFNS